jgi:DNA-binding CsgD family transcriptional regulator
MDDGLVGRDSERAWLQAAAARARDGRGALLLVAGEAGVGKTALVRSALAGTGLDVLEGAAVPAGGAFGPVVAVLREVEVVRLVAGGRTNREIARDLFLSPRTMEMHVASIMTKLDCRSRTDAARRAAELGLLATP